MNKAQIENNFRQIENMQNGDDNCFVCAWHNEKAVEPRSTRQRVCGKLNFAPHGVESRNKYYDFICDRFDRSQFFK